MNKIVCICGSTRFRKEIEAANREETLKGNIVLAPGVFGHSGDDITEDQKNQLDKLHFKKIDMCDEVLVVNPCGYIGNSTNAEIKYAVSKGIHVRYRDYETRLQ